ncbi:MAG: AMP-dependent synthetase/ligase, partial [Bacteroidota bacterium]
SLAAIHLEKGEMVGIFSNNRPEWLMTDLAIMASKAVSVPLYATSSAVTLAYIIRETGMKIIFCGAREQLDTAIQFLDGKSSLEKIIMLDGTADDHPGVMGFDEFLQLSASRGTITPLVYEPDKYSAEELATVIYTSGTTGEPKGVMLTHDNFMYCFRIHDSRLNVNRSDVSLCFLPLSHVFERMWSHYLLYRGAVNVFLENPREVIEVLSQVRPTLMCTVPRFFDKTYAGIQAEVKKWSPLKQRIFKWAVAKGHRAIEYKCRSKKLPLGLAFSHFFANMLVLRKLRLIFGGNIRFMPCAGAAINTGILKFFHAVGIFVNYGYGATETTATVSCFRDDEYFFGTCGSVMPGIEVKISEKNEIMVKGRTVFSGYFKKEEETSRVLQEGWFYTGDEGYLDDKHNLIMTDRIKDLMKTSVGKYISPQKLELLLSHDDLVEQISVVGDNRKYVSALVVPAMDKLRELAAREGISYADDRELVSSERVLAIFEDRFRKLQEELTPYERVVKFTLLHEPFSIESGTMTSTLKLRRSSIEKMYEDLVEKMYADDE